MSSQPPLKQDRLDAWMQGFTGRQAGQAQAGDYIRAYLQCFNAAEYYEAHDVLEHHWLSLSRAAPEWRCFKGLIQLAGGFVHLRLHYLEPGHRVHGRRLAPAGKLLALALANLADTREVLSAHGLDFTEIEEVIRRYVPREGGGNPWRPETRPRLGWAGLSEPCGPR